MTDIEWTDESWNPVTGCDPISPGCRNCYAESMACRLQAMGQPRYRNGFRVTLHWDLLDRPFGWKKPSRVFVNSMSDLFHHNVPIDFLQRAFETMRRTRRHQYQILTKRAKRLLALDPQLDWPANVWMGVSVETATYAYRVDCLRCTHAKIKFLSLEPLLGPLDHLDLAGIDWVIVGGESGHGARPLSLSWVRAIRDQCRAAGVALFVKQLGAAWAKVSDARKPDGRRDSKGVNPACWPEDLRIREYPRERGEIDDEL